MRVTSGAESAAAAGRPMERGIYGRRKATPEHRKTRPAPALELLAPAPPLAGRSRNAARRGRTGGTVLVVHLVLGDVV